MQSPYISNYSFINLGFKGETAPNLTAAATPASIAPIHIFNF